MLLFLFLFIQPSHAGILEYLSEGAYYLSTFGQGCGGKYDSTKGQEALIWSRAKLVDHIKSSIEFPQESKDELRVCKLKKETPDDLYFSLLAIQHANELGCAARFGRTVSESDSEQMEDIVLKFQLTRGARQNLQSAIKELAENPLTRGHVCPLSPHELRPIVPGEKDPHNEICTKIIYNRLAYQLFSNSIPLGGIEAIDKYMQEYAVQKEDFSDAKLEKKLKKLYMNASHLLKEESKKLQATVKEKGGSGFSRGDRYLLLSDPGLVAKVSLLKSGDLKGADPNITQLACKADAKYGKGADALKRGVTIGSFVIGGYLGVAEKLGAAGAGIAEGAYAARAAGLLTFTTARTLQMAAFAMDAIAAYSNLENACFSKSRPSHIAKNSCVSAPMVSQLKEESCTLAVVVEALGFGAKIPMERFEKYMDKLDKAVQVRGIVHDETKESQESGKKKCAKDDEDCE